MKRTPLKRKSATKRRKSAVLCATLRCSRRPATGSTLCVQHLEAKADRLFSAWVRDRDGRCTFPEYSNDACGKTTDLQAAHIIGRRNKAVRYDPRNVHALCREHHVMVDQHGREFAKYDWAISILGSHSWFKLREEARTPKPRIAAALEALAWLETA